MNTLEVLESINSILKVDKVYEPDLFELVKLLGDEVLLNQSLDANKMRVILELPNFYGVAYALNSILKSGYKIKFVKLNEKKRSFDKFLEYYFELNYLSKTKRVEFFLS